MLTYKMFIGGKWVEAESGKTYKVVNPATEAEIAQVPLGDKGDVDKAVAAARKALPLWSKKTPAERTEILNRIAGAIDEHTKELAELDMLDHGSPIGLARAFADTASQQVRYFAQISRALIGSSIPVGPSASCYFQREPIGVCALMIPWNVPMAVTGKLSAALAAGNSCIIKPASVDSLIALKLAEIIEKQNLPPGVVNVVTGLGNTVGEMLVLHPGVNMVALVGSSETGKRIMECASQTVKRVALELGGKNPFIVLEDANVDAAVVKAIPASFFNSGMVCASPGRYYIHEKIYDEFAEKFIDGAKKFVIGDPTDARTQMGPVVSAEHRDKVESYIKIGIEEGATLALGGERPTEPPMDKGYYIVPTVFTNVSQNMRIAREEIFGPVACLIKFSAKDNIVELANDTNYGLCASVWTKDVTKAIRYANEIQAGTVWINDHMARRDEVPWGGYKESGIGKDNSMLGLEEFTQVKLVAINLA
jgi:acyl-CoA reductase-like NAD-dependent aldehyde dehydrogenase